MKIKRNTNSLQNQLAKMLQAGKENVDNSSDSEKVIEQNSNASLHANTQASIQAPAQKAPTGAASGAASGTISRAGPSSSTARAKTASCPKTSKNFNLSLKIQKDR